MSLIEKNSATGAGGAVPQAPPRWQFGAAELGGRDLRLTVAGTQVPLDRSSHDLLLCLLRHGGDTVSKDELLRAGWPGRVVTENSLAKAIGRLRHAIGDADGERLRVVHGYGYRLLVDPLIDASGPPSVPAAETQLPAATPPAEGSHDPVPIRVSTSAARAAAAHANRRRWWTPLVIGSVLVFAAVGAIHIGSRSAGPAVAVPTESTAAAPPASIAVLPLVDLSEAQDQAYFSDGLAEQLLDTLARVPQLHVVGRTSSFAFRGKDLDLPTIGRKLGAQTILEGSVRKSADRIRVTVQLIKALDGYHMWSQTYDRPVTELFAMQDEIVRAIVSALRIELLPEQQRELVRHATTNAEAYDEYLLASEVFKDDETAHRRSIAHLERAVALDPQFVDAWIELAGLLGYSGMYADKASEALAGKRRAIDILDHVIAIAPERADAYLQRGVLRTAHWWDWRGARQDFDRVAALGWAEREGYLCESARLFAALGNLPAAIERDRRAGEINPQSGTAWTVMGYHYIGLGQFDRAGAALQQAVRNAPLDEHARYYLGLVELLQGRSAAALPHFEDSAHVLRLTGLALAHHALGDEAASDQDVQLLITRYGHILPFNVAEVYAWRGESDKAFEWLDRAYELHDASFIYFLFDPLLKSLRSDPRYDALRIKLGLPSTR